MKPLTPQQQDMFNQYLQEVCENPEARQMQEFVQHGSISTYQHCTQVAARAFRMAVNVPGIDLQSLVHGAFLHDFYGYDWHEPGHTKHATQHPVYAAEHAARVFRLNALELSIIRTHMWPLPPVRVPQSREAWIVCAADKACALQETLFHR